jgi:phosphoglycolate phosphatase-like HAD superfamily hydrolase
VEKLKDTFGTTRDRWIESDFNSWLKLNEFYPGVIESVKNSPYPVYIVTTKQKRFTTALCKFAGLDLPETRIFGLEKGEKSISLKQIHLENPGSSILFVEDRLDNLLDAKVDEARFHKFYADWGYGTKEDYKTARENPQISVLELSVFPQFMFNPADFLE